MNVAFKDSSETVSQCAKLIQNQFSIFAFVSIFITDSVEKATSKYHFAVENRLFKSAVNLQN